VVLALSEDGTLGITGRTGLVGHQIDLPPCAFRHLGVARHGHPTPAS
jgi:hypothetical protein